VYTQIPCEDQLGWNGVSMQLQIENAASERAEGCLWHPRARSVYAVLVMLAAVLAIYMPWDTKPNQSLVGSDYYQLHLRRIKYAQQAIFSEKPRLPAWYSRELLGAPFWSNIQSFPWIPSRLPLLLMDPYTSYATGVYLSACLAALFTFLFCRRVGMGRVGSATAGWTFACSGYFAARVMVGHLPLLEAYPALPLLLWLAEVCIQARVNRWMAVKLLALGFGSMCTVLAGHPQLPVYAGVTAALYVLLRSFNRRGIVVLAAMAFGVGCAAFVLWPMLLLIGRSTRVLPLETADNDYAFPMWRLAAWLLPWTHGWSDLVVRNPHRPIVRGGEALFWDTVCYVGWLPLLAAATLTIRAIIQRRVPSRPWLILGGIGIAAMILALPGPRVLFASIPGTILRSPSRQVYLTIFALALAAGIGIDLLLRLSTARAWVAAAAVLLLIVHGIDLGGHDRAFVRRFPVGEVRGSQQDDTPLRKFIGDERIAVDYVMPTANNRDIDDVGFFDSIMLAKPYAALMAACNAPPKLNRQDMDGSEMSARALQYACAKLLVTYRQRPDLKRVGGKEKLNLYEIPNPRWKIGFIPRSDARTATLEEVHQHLRNRSADIHRTVLLPEGDYGLPPDASYLNGSATFTYQRHSSDERTMSVTCQRPGFLRIVESWDPGWHASINGKPTRPILADGAVMALPIPPGTHEVKLWYVTPGATAGVWISITNLLLLGILAAGSRRLESWTWCKTKPAGVAIAGARV
jgi:hypothetical protein